MIRMKKAFLFSISLLLILFSTSRPSAPDARGQAFDPVPADQPVLARIPFESQQELDRLAADLDIWEVHRQPGSVVALLQQEQVTALTSSGYRVQVIRQSTPLQTGASSDTSCYRTIDVLERELQTIAAGHAGLAELRTIGSSYEGRPLQVMRLTNRGLAGSKPVFFLIANLHGREYITPETAMAFIETLIGRYGVDADVTWLLDYHEIHVLVSANPDGHIKNEGNVSQVFWRKNTQPYGSCSPEFLGVDLNRNYSPSWGCCGGSSEDACSEVYRGPDPDSEAETQSVQSYLRNLFPDQRGPGQDEAAPLDATGLMISLHSYGDLVLWPWGWTHTEAPNARELALLGERLAGYNQYQPVQSSGLYLADGTLDDWAYGELGVAAYTFEIGSGADGFYPACDRLSALIQPNISALVYAAKVAGTPYLTAQGPHVADLAVVVSPILLDNPVLTAWVATRGQDGRSVAAAEAAVDLPAWAGGGSALLMQPVDGAYDQDREQVQLVLDGEDLQAGRHILFVRGQDSAGVWGPASAVFFTAGAAPFASFLPILITGPLGSK